MKHYALALGIVALSCSACGNDPSPQIFLGSGGGSSTSSGNGGNGGAGGAVPEEPDGLVFPGTLPPYPLAVTPDGQAWLFTGDYVSQGPGYPGAWYSARLWKVDSQNAISTVILFEESGLFVEPRAIKADSQGNVVLLAQVTRGPDGGSTLEIAGQSVLFSADSSAFIAKLDPNGKPLWIKVIEGEFGPDQNGLPGSLQLADVGMDDQGRVYVATLLHGTADFGGGPVTHEDAVVFVLSKEGQYLEHRILSAKDSVFLKLEVEPSGVTWIARSSLALHARVEKFDEMGLPVSEKWWPICWVETFAFALDGQNGFFSVRAEDVAEHCQSVTMEHVAPAGSTDWFVGEGNYHAVRPAIVASSPGHAWLGVGLEGKMGNLTGNTIDDIVLAEIDQKGDVSKMTTHGGPGIDEVVQMGIDASGSLWLTGYFAERIDFGSGELHNTSGKPRAIYLSRRAP